MNQRPGVKAVTSACRLTVYVAEPHRRGQRYAVAVFLRRAAELGCPGGTVFQGLVGFGRAGHLHETRVLHGPDETPLSVIIVDTWDRVTALLQVLDELLPDAVAVLDGIDTIRYSQVHHGQHADDHGGWVALGSWRPAPRCGCT